jgi:hypothetical protein
MCTDLVSESAFYYLVWLEFKQTSHIISFGGPVLVP